MRISSKMKIKSEETNSILFWVIMIFVTTFLFVAPFQRGLFNGYQLSFERPIYTFLTWVSLILLILSIYLFKHWGFRDHREKLGLLIWLIPLSYLISTVHAASYHLAINEVFLHVSYCVFFLIGSSSATNKLGSNILKYAIICSGYLLVIYGLMNWFGNASYPSAILSENRLSNVFQYPNSYAAYLNAILLSTVLLIQNSKKWYTTFTYAFFLVPIFVSILFTLSRGGLMVLSVIFLICLFFLPWIKQLMVLIYLALTAFSSVLIFSYLTGIRQDLSQEFNGIISLKGWSVLAVVSLAVCIAIVFIEKYVKVKLYSKLSNPIEFRYTNIILPLIFILVELLGAYSLFGNTSLNEMLPEALKQRIENIDSESSTVFARTTFYKDAIKLVNDYPLIGAGGGGWSSLYDTYKSYPYTSRQAHNFFLQYLVEVGYVGLTILLGILMYIFFIFLRNYFLKDRNEDLRNNSFLFMIIALSILAHSLVDFDMSFVYLAAVVFLCLGGMVSFSLNKANELIKDSRNWLRVFPVLLGIISVICLISSLQYIQANTKYASILVDLNQKKDFNSINQQLNNILKSEPHQPEYVLLKISLLRQAFEQTKDVKYFEEALAEINKLKEPYDRRFWEERYSLYILKGDLQKAYKLTLEGIQKFPLEISIYERNIRLNFDLGMKVQNTNLTKEKDEYWQQAVDRYNSILEKRKDLDKLPVVPKFESRNFKITPIISLYIGQIYYLKGEYAKASSILNIKEMAQFDDPLNRSILRWYLASLQKQNKKDSKLLDDLLDKYPEEKDNLKLILNLNL